jgi:hypothetical protein
MKNKSIFSIIILLVCLATSCEYDNYDPPGITFNGKLTTNGESFLYDGNPGKPVLELIQKGFGKVDNGTVVRIDEEGKFQQLIFEGDYWLTLNNVKYPFEFADFNSLGAGLGYDSIQMHITSNVTKNLEVAPYFFISNFKASVEGDNIVLRADVSVNPNTRNPAPRVLFARGYASTSAIVNSNSGCTKSQRTVITSTGSVEISLPIHNNITAYREIYINNFRDYAFCRIALELDGIANYYLFSETIKVEGIPL